ncbi:MAG: ComEC/Rec2 family competence protein [Parabacteroides sp.]|nr:ComEC/Rec2 family competence protein [Parabacteroides sp.]
MIKELHISPFARPLCVWIIGVLLQVNFSIAYESLFMLLILWGFLFLSWAICLETNRTVWVYEGRWIWGVTFMFMLLCVAVLQTCYVELGYCFSFVNEELLLFAAHLREILLNHLEYLHLLEEEKAVLGTITLGYKEGMDWEVRKQFSMAGVVHLLSVSGFHVAIVGRLISSALFFMPRNGVGKWLRYGLTLLFLWLFVLISGMAAPAIRAALMITLLLTGKVLERLTERYNILFASAFCMLVYNPLYLFDVGFQLSYLAVFSILYFYPRILRLIPVRNPLFRIPWGWIAVSVSAQLGTVGLCLYYFGEFSTVFLLANLPLTLFVTILIPVALIWMLLPIDEGWIYVGLKNVVEWLTASLFDIVKMFSQVSGATVSFRFDFISMLTFYGIGVSICLYFHFKQIKYVWSVFLFVLILMICRMIEKNILCGI